MNRRCSGAKQFALMGKFPNQPNRGMRARFERLKGEAIMERDVVCGMQVDPAKAAGKSEYNGKTYYFCSLGCKKKFDANPSQYAGK